MEGTQATKLRAVDVKNVLGDPRSMAAFREWLRREEAAGRFPARIRFSERTSFWVRADVERWLARRPRGVRRPEPLEAAAR